MKTLQQPWILPLIYLHQLQVFLPHLNLQYLAPQTLVMLTPTTPSKRQRSYISETTSSSLLHRPPITEIPINTRPQQTPINTSIIHIPNPESVEQYVTYNHPTAIKTVRLQPQLNLVQIPDTEYTKLPPLKLPSELSTTPSKLYPPLSSVLLMQKRKEKYAFKVPLSTVVLIEPYGIIIHYRSLLLLIR